MVTVAVGGLVQESNAFAVTRTARADFLTVEPAKMRRAFEGTSTEIAGFLSVADAQATEVVPAGFAFAGTSGLLDDDSARSLCNELAERVVGADPDVVLLALHGSMASTGIDDVEGLLLSQLREALGPGVAIAATLDWHCSMTPNMVESADFLVGYRTYPHIDQQERAVTAARLALAQASGQITPTASWVHPPMIVAGPKTSHQQSPMREVLARAEALAARHETVLDWSLCPGYARSDVPLAGAHVYVLTDDDPGTARVLAGEIGLALWEQRRSFVADLTAVDDAVAAALAHDTSSPVILSDQGDNPGGGSPGDGTTLLAALLESGAHDAVIAALWDPLVVEAALAAGVGGQLETPLGGRTDDRHGAPVPVQAHVEHLTDGKYTMRSPTHNGVRRRIGPTATLRIGGVRVVVTSERVQNEDLEMLEMAGIDPRAARVIAVKSNAHFRAAFEPIASRVLDVDTPGLSTPHLERLPFERIERPVFPLDDPVWSPS